MYKYIYIYINIYIYIYTYMYIYIYICSQPAGRPAGRAGRRASGSVSVSRSVSTVGRSVAWLWRLGCSVGNGFGRVCLVRNPSVGQPVGRSVRPQGVGPHRTSCSQHLGTVCPRGWGLTARGQCPTWGRGCPAPGAPRPRPPWGFRLTDMKEA